MDKEYYLNDPRFKSIELFPNKIWLSSSTMHGDEQRWGDGAIQTNWVSTVGENINEVERIIAKKSVASILWAYPPVQRYFISLLKSVFGQIVSI